MDKVAGSRLLENIKRDGLYNYYLILFRKYTEFFNPEYSMDKAVHIMKEDWDHLIVLDACRYDMFKEIVDSNAGYIISAGSTTQEWIRNNFKGKFKDVVCIAGNPHLSSANLYKTFGFVPFYEIIEVWDFGWDKKLKTVPPQTVTFEAIEAINKYPNKRLLIHYNQPHHPFISDKYLLSKDDGTWHTLEGGMWGGEKTTVWELVRHGQISIERVWKGYRENLKIVIKEVNRLIEELCGKIVITSDHGNHLGENRVYGHVSGIRSEESVKVPWYIIKKQKKYDDRSLLEHKMNSHKLELELIQKKIKSLKFNSRL